MATIRKQGRAIKRLVPGVPTSAHDPTHKAEAASLDAEQVQTSKRNRHERRKAAALARQRKVA